MKITTFEIKFDNPQGVFQAGGLVSGHVHLTLVKPLKMRSKLFVYLICLSTELHFLYFPSLYR